jgi:hypothetical protein
VRTSAYKLTPADIPFRLHFSSIVRRSAVVRGVVWNTVTLRFFHLDMSPNVTQHGKFDYR